VFSFQGEGGERGGIFFSSKMAKRCESCPIGPVSCTITIAFICVTIIIYSIAKGTLKQEQQEKEILIMILITDNQATSFLDDRILQ